MTIEKTLDTVRLFYIGGIVDSLLHFQKHGVLKAVAEDKRNAGLARGPMQVRKLGISDPRHVFLKTAELFACASWTITEEGDGFVAEARSCRLCAMCKKAQAPSPCFMYCLDPLRGMLKALDPTLEFSMVETLWNGERCRVKIGGK